MYRYIISVFTANRITGKEVKLSRRKKINKRILRTYGPRPDNGIDVGVKVYALERFRERIPGWKIVRKTKVKKNGQRLYVTYYQSTNHIQDFIDRIHRNKDWNERVVGMQQFMTDPRADDYDDPALWPYQMLLLTNEPLDEEFDDWEILCGPDEAAGLKDLWITIYRSKENLFNDLTEEIRSTRRLDRIVERAIPSLVSQHDPFHMAKKRKQYEEIDHNQRKSITVTRGGGSRQTKYEYPPDCTSKADRSKYRRMMRKKRKS